MPNLSARLGVCVISACKSYKALLEFRGPCEVSSEWVDWMACESRSIFKALPVVLTTAFLWDSPPGYIYLMLPSWVTVITTFSWQEHLYRTVPLCIAGLLWIYITTGYYIRIDIARDPNPLVTIFNWLFWLIGSEFAEL